MKSNLTFEGILKNLDLAAAEEQLFFFPYIGREYLSGLEIVPRKRRRTLVIGASRYCTLHCNSHHCCENEFSPAKLHSLFKNRRQCAIMPKGKLEFINPVSILKARDNYLIEEERKMIPYTYVQFTEALERILGIDAYYLWDSLAFINFLQTIVPTVKTPPFKGNEELYRKSSEIVEKVIEILDPECIIMWASDPIDNSIGKIFPYATVDEDFAIRLESKHSRKGYRQYAKYDLPINGKNYVLLTSPHPAYGNKRTVEYYKELQANDFLREEYLQMENFRLRKKITLENYDDWEDFWEVLSLFAEDYSQ